MHLRARRYHKNRSAFLCLSFFCVTLLREALVYFTRFYALLRAFISVKQFTPFTVYSVNNLGLLSFQRYTDFNFYPLRLQLTPFTIYSVQGYTIFQRSTAD